MLSIRAFLILTVLLLPLAAATNCPAAPQAVCGKVGLGCQYYTWGNGANNGSAASCQPPASCPTNPKVTVWSNASYNCEPCESSTSSSLCTLCQTYNFYFNTKQGSCQKCSIGYGMACTSCNSAQCTNCALGFRLASNKLSCQNTNCSLSYCDVCQNATNCKTCDATHIAYNGKCICKINNCQLCQFGLCISCFPNYILNSAKTTCTLKCMDNCDVCTNLYTCTTCSKGFYYNAKINQCRINCTAIDTNCNSCPFTTICASCVKGYIPSISRTSCNPVCLDPYCITCQTNTTCSQCKTGYTPTLNATSNAIVCTLDICTVSFCKVCATTTSCATCLNYFNLNNSTGACLPACNILNCYTCSSPTVCSSCVGGYKIYNSSCVPICTIANCQTCESEITCQKCNNGFNLSPNAQTCTYNCRISGCITCDSATTCSQCIPGTSLANNNTRCKYDCRPGYYLSSSNKCVSCPQNCIQCNQIGLCITCLDFYFVDNSTLKCQSCSSVTGCYNCDASTGLCTKCLKGYSLYSGKCSQVTCSVANCATCVQGNANSCDQCSSGYSVTDGGACAVISCPGDQILVGSTCTCGLKSYLNGGQCIPCDDENCVQCTKSACITCAVGYYPEGTVCVACAYQNCKSCDSTGCNQCNDKFFLKNGRCQQKLSKKVLSVSRDNKIIACTPGCKVCDIDIENNLICIEAESGYIIVSGVIYKCTPPCTVCSSYLDSSKSASNCLACPNGYALSYGTCIKCNDTNAITCLDYLPTFSIKCKIGYTTTNMSTGVAVLTGVCSACADNCDKCDLTGSGNCDVGGCSKSTVKKQTGCLPCFKGCFRCASDPNNCLQCAKYYYLSKGDCIACSPNCVSCNATTCMNCQAGTFLFNSSCIVPTDVPHCVSYDASYTKCQDCDFNYVLNNSSNICILSMACNSTANCTNCPYGYYVSSKQCLPCPAIANCSSCSDLNSTVCIDCAKGYYLVAGACKPCNISGCSACSTAQICTTASSGYYLVLDISGDNTGIVMPCDGNCKTCIMAETSCLSCIEGTSLFGTQCVANEYLTLTITLTVKNMAKDVTQDVQKGKALNFINGYNGRLSSALGFKSRKQYQRHFRIWKLGVGSVILTINGDTKTTSVDPVAAVNSVNDPNLGLVQVSAARNSNSSDSTTNLGLILGVSIPLGILLIVIVVLIKSSGSGSDDDLTQGKKLFDQTEKEIKKEDQG